MKAPTPTTVSKQQYPPLNNITNKPMNENYWTQELFKIKEYFSKELNLQAAMINTLKAKIEEQGRQIHSKEEEIRSLKEKIEKGNNSNPDLFHFSKKISEI